MLILIDLSYCDYVLSKKLGLIMLLYECYVCVMVIVIWDSDVGSIGGKHPLDEYASTWILCGSIRRMLILLLAHAT